MQMLKDQDAQHLPGGKFNGWEKIVIAIVCKGKSRYETTEVFEKKHEKNILCPSDGTIHLLDLGSCCLKIFAQCESQIPLPRLRPFSGYPVYPSESPEHSIARYHAK